MSIIVACVLLLLGGFAVYLHHILFARPSQRLWQTYINGRDPMTDEEFIAACCQPEQMDPRAVAAVRQVLGENLDASPEKAPFITHPGDDLWDAMSQVDGNPMWDLDMIGIIRQAEREVRVRGGPRIRYDLRSGGRNNFRDPEELALMISNCLREHERTASQEEKSHDADHPR